MFNKSLMAGPSTVKIWIFF